MLGPESIAGLIEAEIGMELACALSSALLAESGLATPP